jgi:hypothetical protein
MMKMNRTCVMKACGSQRVTLADDENCRQPVTGYGYHGQQLDPLDLLKNQLLGMQLASVRDTELELRLRRAADESASIAWATSYPLLTLPELLREKTAQAFAQHERQRSIQSRARAVAQIAA